jgi:hypothetical protein
LIRSRELDGDGSRKRVWIRGELTEQEKIVEVDYAKKSDMSGRKGVSRDVKRVELHATTFTDVG